MRDLCWPGEAMEHTSTTTTELKCTAMRSCACTGCQKSGVIEGKSTKIAQILDELIMHSHIQTKVDPIWYEVIDAQPHTD